MAIIHPNDNNAKGAKFTPWHYLFGYSLVFRKIAPARPGSDTRNEPGQSRFTHSILYRNREVRSAPGR
jgi:hypothetical protein